jgi:DNA-binding transcriptional LysR family regulator
MNPRLLLTLCAIDETGSLAAAARKLNLSPAAITERIQLLERELDAKLVSRAGRTVALTAAGASVVPLARELLERMGQLKQQAHPQELRGRLTVGAISTALISLLPGTLQQIASEHPGLDLRVVPGTSDVLYDRVASGDIDCALMVRPPFPISKDLQWLAVRDEPLVLLTSYGDAQRSPDLILASRPLIRVDPSAWTGQIITRYLRESGMSVSELFELDALEAIVILVANKVGVALLPDWGISGSTGLLVDKVAIPSRAYDRSIGLIARTVSPRGPLVAAFKRAVVAGTAVVPKE